MNHALVRSRCVVGDEKLSSRVRQIREQVLSNQRDTAELAEKVREMRAKMRGKLDKSNDQLFDLKQGVGAMTDIEFMVQFAVLAWSANLPELLVYTDNIRILEALVASGKLEQAEGEMLAEAYRRYRSEANYCVLQERPALAPIAQVGDYPQQVASIWQRWLGEEPTGSD